MIALALMAWALSIGFFMVRALAGGAWGNWAQVCLGAGVGVGTVSCCFFGELKTGVPSIVFELVVLAVSVSMCRKKRWRVGAPGEATPLNWWLSGAFPVVFAVVLACALYGFYRQVSSNLNGSWDAFAIWNLHARFLATPWWRDLFTETIGWTHPDYPLLLPGFIARVWGAEGYPDQSVPVAVAFVFCIATMGLLGALVAALKGRAQGTLAALFLAATPYFITQAGSLIADVPLSFFILATVALTVIGTGRGVWGLAGICAGMAAWTKNEGLLLAVVVVAVQVVAMKGRRSQLAWLGAGLGSVLAVVLVFKVTLATSNGHLGGRSFTDLLRLATDGRRWRLMLVELTKGIARFGGLALGIPPVLAAYVDEKADRRGLLSGLATVGLMLVGYCVVCVISPADLQWQIDTALSRLLLQLWPATLFLAFVGSRYAFARTSFWKSS